MLLFVPAVADAALPAKIRIEGVHKTLVSERTVTLADAPIVKDGDASHSCPGTSALGALQAGTNGDWTGKWSEGLGYFVSSIRGEKPAGSSFFSLWVNHRLSTTGGCDTKLKRNDSVLLFVDRCVFDSATNGCKNKPVTPLGVRVTPRVRRGSRFTVSVVRYTNSGRPVPQAGARVFANQRPLRGHTDAKGHLRVRATHVGGVSFFATHTGNAKSETEKTRVLKP
jgi:hypothetical protein